MTVTNKLVRWEERQQTLKAEAERRREDAIHDYRVLRAEAVDAGRWLRDGIAGEACTVRSFRFLVAGANKATADALYARSLTRLGGELTRRVRLRLERSGVR